MIASLRGRLLFAGPDQAIVDVGGVGYRCFIPGSTRARLPAAGREVVLHTHLAVREDALTLFGFLDLDEFQLFEHLIAVDGVGPKLALAVLSGIEPRAFRRALLFDDMKALTAIAGVGKKTAQRIMLELKDKLGSLGGPEEAEAPAAVPAAAGRGDAFGEALEALAALGFSRAEAGSALEKVRAQAGEAPNTEALVRLGLKQLSAGVR